MSVVVVERPPRAVPPGVPSGEIRLAPPPGLPRRDRTAPPLPPLLGTAAAALLLLLWPGAAAGFRLVGAALAVFAATPAALWAARALRGPHGAADQARSAYLEYLARVRERARRAAHDLRAARLRLHPEPGQLWAVVAERDRLWERRADDADFAQVRVGLGPQPPALRLIAPDAGPGGPAEPLSAAALRRLLAAYASLDGMPAVVSLRAFPRLTVSGDPDAARSAVRALLAQLATWHAPRDLVIAVASADGAVGHWRWVTWLPHTAAGGRRLCGADPAELADLLGTVLRGRPPFTRGAGPLPDRPHLVVVLDGTPVPQSSPFAPGAEPHGVTVVEIAPGSPAAPRPGLSMAVHPGRLLLDAPGGRPYQARPDALTEPEAEALARHLAPLRA